MRADEEGGRNFYSHLRDAYEALEVGNRPEAERSIRAALDIDPCALAAVEWWSYLHAESVLTAASDAELSIDVTEFDALTTVERWEDEFATVAPLRPRTDWRTSVVVRGLKRLLCAPVFPHAAALFSVCALLIASVTHLPLPRPRMLAPAPPALVMTSESKPVAPMPAFTPPLAAADANEAGPRWLSPRLERLGVLPHWRAAVIGLDDRLLLSELQQSIGELWIGRAGGGENDAIILGVSDASGLAQLSLLEPSLKAGGVLWVVHAVNDVTITRQAIKAAARDAHLSYLASTRLASRVIAEKLVRQRAPRART